ncbi:NAD(+) diphosphatase [Zhihengliuella halotolerans]|uniref:NAD(+) diphosphatase n=1 Tax=Zhihengliuella halotolerans TaxID=370736 RepID=A0A4Q8AAB2_9MICC|nr:NAD(+) diphosphatase [Zhihengliuella halotolerans]RZU61047.1 NAD+ diphosphatase [Zhihengliuella halotolerans]
MQTSRPRTADAAPVPYLLERSSEDRASEAWLPSVTADPETRYLPILSGRSAHSGAVEADGARLRWFTREEVAAFAPRDAAEIYLGRLNDDAASPAAGRHLVAVVVDVVAEDRFASYRRLRELAPLLDAAEAEILISATAIVNWHAGHTHCPRCGAPTVVVHSGWVRRCSADGTEHFPRTDPAIIVSIIDREDRLLLGANARWGGQRYSTLAGFVEPGESLEAAVVREVAEEAGIVVHSPEYVASQPWPFPASLMLAFRAQTDDVDVVPDGEEIIDLRWFTRDQLAEDVRSGRIAAPTPASVARSLIELWYGGPLPEPRQPESQRA